MTRGLPRWMRGRVVGEGGAATDGAEPVANSSPDVVRPTIAPTSVSMHQQRVQPALEWTSLVGAQSAKGQAAGLATSLLRPQSKEDLQPTLEPVRVCIVSSADEIAVSRTCVEASIGVLTKADCISVSLIDVDSLGDLDTSGKYDVVLITGGEPLRLRKLIGGKGAQAIRRFVASGGSYVGVCAGAVLATQNAPTLDLLPLFVASMTMCGGPRAYLGLLDWIDAMILIARLEQRTSQQCNHLLKPSYPSQMHCRRTSI